MGTLALKVSQILMDYHIFKYYRVYSEMRSNLCCSVKKILAPDPVQQLTSVYKLLLLKERNCKCSLGLK